MSEAVKVEITHRTFKVFLGVYTNCGALFAPAPCCGRSWRGTRVRVDEWVREGGRGWERVGEGGRGREKVGEEFAFESLDSQQKVAPKQKLVCCQLEEHNLPISAGAEEGIKEYQPLVYHRCAQQCPYEGSDAGQILPFAP